MEPAGPAETQGLLAGARVLVVEDDFIILNGLEMVFAEAGAEVLFSRTVGDALVKGGPAVRRGVTKRSCIGTFSLTFSSRTPHAFF